MHLTLSPHSEARTNKKTRWGLNESRARENNKSRSVYKSTRAHRRLRTQPHISHTHVYSVRHQAADWMCRDVYEARTANANKKCVRVSWRVLLCSARSPIAICATRKMLCGNARQENRQSRMNRVIVCRACVAYSQFRSVFFESSYDEAVFSVRGLPFYCLFLFVVLPLVLSQHPRCKSFRLGSNKFHSYFCFYHKLHINKVDFQWTLVNLDSSVRDKRSASLNWRTKFKKINEKNV